MVLNGFNQLQQGWAINEVNGFAGGKGFCNQLLELAPGQIFDCADVALGVQSQAFFCGG